MKVLLVDDDSVFTELLGQVIRESHPEAAVLQAHTTSKARQLFRANPDVGIIVMDGCVPGHSFNTLGLIGDILAWGFDGLMIATSSNDDIRYRMLAAGCDVEMTKERLLSGCSTQPI